MKKKQSLSSTFVWLKDVGFKAFAVLALVAGGFYVLAVDIAYPPTAPNPTTGVVGTFVGESSKAFADVASPARGYADVNGLCLSITDSDGNTVTGAHVCTSDEVVNSNNHGTVGVSPIFNYYKGTIATQILWVNNGPPGYTANANDCAGWSDITTSSYGTAWDFRFKKGFLRSCGEPSKIKFACCK